jgi:short-subunit dehydrogenase
MIPTPAPAPSRPLAVVTGASSGIGEQFARRHAREGHDLVLVARSAGVLGALANELAARHGVAVEVRALDLSNADDVAALAVAITDELPRVDHLVNCAGVAPEGDLVDADADVLRQMVDLNVTALTLLTRAAVVRMRRAGHGTIVNIASAAAHQPMPHLAAYAASKSYVLRFTEALSEENRGHGLRILAVSPGDTDTPMNPGSAKGKREPEQVVDTTWKALAGRAPSVVDGRANSVLATVSVRLLTRRLGLRVAERMMRDKA